MNADGYSDVIVGAIGYDNGQPQEGRAFLYLGSSSGPASTPAWTALGHTDFAQFGRSLASAGDVNGDGYSDVIVGAYQYSDVEGSEGAAFLYLGSASGLASTASWSAEGNQWNANFGESVASAGDVDGDGFSDVIVGAHGYSFAASAFEGAALVYFGSSSGLAATASWIAAGPAPVSGLGFCVAGAGDVNGDGFADVVVGSQSLAHLYPGNGGRGWTLAPQQRRVNSSSRIGLLGRSNDPQAIRLRLGFERKLASFAWASGRTPTARLEWELAPLRLPLDGSRIQSGPEQSFTGTPLTFDEIAPLLTGQRIATGPFHWRARVRTNNPVLPVTPWVSVPGDNVTESKLRAPPLAPRAPTR